ncbi:MAG: cysteine-rich CWC family protein, partial [Limisphaerales bacterium]
MNPNPAKIMDAAHCPLCGQPNDCQLCTVAAYKGQCWCAQVAMPDALLAQVPPDLRNQTCICRDCVMKFHRSHANKVAVPKVLPGDFYFDAGLMVFTAEYH